MKSLMKTKKVGRFYDGGEVEAMGSGDLPASVDTSRDSPAAEPSSFKEAFASARKGGAKTFEYKGKKYTTDTAPARSSAPVAGRPRGESGPVSTTRQMADRAAGDAMNARAASEARAAKARESEADMRRESRGRSAPDTTAPKRKVLSTEGVDSKTLLPQKYASGGLVKRGALKSHGKAC